MPNCHRSTHSGRTRALRVGSNPSVAPRTLRQHLALLHRSWTSCLGTSINVGVSIGTVTFQLTCRAGQLCWSLDQVSWTACFTRELEVVTASIVLLCFYWSVIPGGVTIPTQVSIRVRR